MLRLIKNDIVAVEWEDIGEGWNGEYNPDDPKDTPLLRFYVQKNNGGLWEDVEGASYCTQMPADTNDQILVRALGSIIQEIYDAVVDNSSIKKACERLSWLCPDDFKNKGV